MKTRRNILTAVLMLSLVACRNDESWTNAEKSLIKGDGEAMRVLTIYDKADSLVLRTECSGNSTKELTSDEYKILAEKMVATVTSPEQDGVGIAGPQVGISRRVVAVQRFPKSGLGRRYPSAWGSGRAHPRRSCRQPASRPERQPAQHGPPQP